MTMLLIIAVVLVGAMALLAYRLATFALPFMLALEAARFAYATGAGWIGAGIVGFFAGVATFGILAYLFATPRAPILRLAVAIVFAAPAAVAGYALVHGVTRGLFLPKSGGNPSVSRAVSSSAALRWRDWPTPPSSIRIVDVSHFDGF